MKAWPVWLALQLPWVVGGCRTNQEPGAQAPDQVVTIASAEPAASRGPVALAPASASSAEAEAPELPPEPPAPPKRVLDGQAAVVWLAKPKAPAQVESVWVEPGTGAAAIVARRDGPVFVATNELWALGSKAMKSRGCAECDKCLEDPPVCKKDTPLSIDEPFFRSLATGKRLEPWASTFSPMRGCQEGLADHDVSVWFSGAVGPFVFVNLTTYQQYCGAAHGAYGGEAITMDLDTGRPAPVSFPSEVEEILRARAKTELAGDCVLDPNETPSSYRASAAYGSQGELRGVYEYMVSAPYMCGTGPGHYSRLNEQTSAWVPPELLAHGKLPAWLATYTASVEAKAVFVVTPARQKAARAEFSRR